MAVLGRVLEATRANLNVMNRLRELRTGRLEYSEGHPFQALVANLDASPYVGRLAICRVHQGWVHKGDTVAWCRPGPDGEVQRVRIAELYMTEALTRVDAGPRGAGPGDIMAVAGIPEIMIGDTLADAADPRPLPGVTRSCR